MEKPQIDQLNMLLAVENHFDSNASVWTSIIPISDCKTAFSAKIDEITAAAAVQRENSTGATLDKAELRADLEAKGFFVSSAVGAYASVNPTHNQLNKKTNITKTEFDRFRGPELLNVIDNLNTAAMSVIENLAPYRVTQTTLTELVAARVAFHDIMELPEAVTSNRKDATDIIPVLLHQAVWMLDNTMDKLVEVLRAPQPQFVNVYFIDRKIHHTGARRLSLEITTLNANNNAPLADAHLEVVGKGIKRISSQTGLNRVQNLQEGNYTLSVSCLNFVPQMIPFTIMSSETTQLVIEMQKEVAKVQRDKVAEELSE